MLEIEITQLAKAAQSRYPYEATGRVPIQVPKKSSILRQMSSNQTNLKKIVPIREYSNKFLRESKNRESRSKTNISRLNSLVGKHKNFQKKYQKVLGRKHYVCKTEPNQNEYQCFTTAKSFYRPNGEAYHIKPQITANRKYPQPQIKTYTEENEFIMEEEEQSKTIDYTPYQYPQSLKQKVDQKIKDQVYSREEQITKDEKYREEEQRKTKTKHDGFVFCRKDEKISTSRALELFSRIVAKDRGDLLDKIRICNQKKLLKEKMMESSKNLEARQIILTEKAKKFSFIERGQRRSATKTSVKFRQKKKSEICRAVCPEEDNFEIKGWDF